MIAESVEKSEFSGRNRRCFGASGRAAWVTSRDVGQRPVTSRDFWRFANAGVEARATSGTGVQRRSATVAGGAALSRATGVERRSATVAGAEE